MKSVCCHCKKNIESGDLIECIDCINNNYIEIKFSNSNSSKDLHFCHKCENVADKIICKVCFHKHFSGVCDICKKGEVDSSISIHHMQTISMNESEFCEALKQSGYMKINIIEKSETKNPFHIYYQDSTEYGEIYGELEWNLMESKNVDDNDAYINCLYCGGHYTSLLIFKNGVCISLDYNFPCDVYDPNASCIEDED